MNLVVNGGFENNSVTSGTAAPVTGLQEWTNTAGSIEVWRVNGYASEGSSSIETDSTTGKDRIEQSFTTVAGRRNDRDSAGALIDDVQLVAP